MRKPAAVEQRQHGGVAGDESTALLLVGAQLGIGDASRGRRPAAAAAMSCAIFGARTAASAPTLPLPLRSRKRANAAHAGERAHQRAAADAFGAARRHKRAHVRGRQRGEIL